MANLTRKQVVRTAVGARDRFKFLPALFGAQYMARGEDLIYKWAYKLSNDFQGGQWKFYVLSSGSGYLVPNSPDRLMAALPENYFEAEVSADAFGIIVSLYALNKLSFEIHSRGEDPEAVVIAYHALRYFACDHEEARAIIRAID